MVTPQELAAAKKVDKLAWQGYEEGKRNVFFATAPDFKPRRLTNFLTDDGTDLTNVEISDDGSVVVFIRGSAPNREGWVANPSADPNGAERAIWAVKTAGGPAWRVTEGSNRAAKRCWMWFLLGRIVAVHDGAEKLIDPMARELDRHDAPVPGGDDADRNAGRDEAFERLVGAWEQLRLMAAIGGVPDPRRALDHLLGDAERRVHQSPIRGIVLAVTLAGERREAERFQDLDVRGVDRFGRIDQGPVPVEEDRLHRAIVRPAYDRRVNERSAPPIPSRATEPHSVISSFPGGLKIRATWGSSGQAAAVFALSEGGATLVDHGALGAGAESDPDRLCRMELRVETPGGAWAVRLASAIYDEPRAVHWDDGGLFVVGYGFAVYAFAARSGALAWSHQAGTPIVALVSSPRFGHLIVQSEIETWAIRPDGEVRYLRSMARVWRTASGAPTRIVHAIEPRRLDALPGEKKIYGAWTTLQATASSVALGALSSLWSRR